MIEQTKRFLNEVEEKTSFRIQKCADMSSLLFTATIKGAGQISVERLQDGGKQAVKQQLLEILDRMKEEIDLQINKIKTL